MSADDLADKVDQDAHDALDADSVRRTIDRMRDEISNTVRRETGKPIGDNAIIETVSRSSALKGAKGVSSESADRQSGRANLLIRHPVREILRLSDHALMLQSGRLF
jgi:hypothetical protein